MDTPFFGHAANSTGRKILALPPVYPPDLLAREIVRLSRRPRAELVVGGAGRAIVAQHVIAPRLAEKEVALATEWWNLSRQRAANTSDGNLYTPSTGDARVTGGWHGRARTSLRRAAAWAGALVVGLVVARRLGARR